MPLYDSGEVRVARVFTPDGTVILKQPSGPGGVELLRRERQVLRRLAGIVGVVRLVGDSGLPAPPGSIIVQDVTGTRLADQSSPLPSDELLSLARQLARTVADVHARAVMHRDLNPTSITVTGDHQPVLTDFSLATTVAEIRPEFIHHSRIVGALPYLAPEQTGRTGRPVDQRADLYGLGALLYELATGKPPFGTGDPLNVIHGHIAVTPTPPDQLNADLPSTLSHIIMRLLEKEPDNRYQTADGVLSDLNLVYDDQPLTVGEHDYPRRVRSPSRLVGRDAEIAILSDSFTAALTGACRGMLITGPAGVGKTSLINALRPITAARGGWFTAGQFDQYRRDQDYDAVRQALRNLGQLLLAEPEGELVTVRKRIGNSVGPNVGLAAAILPEFATLLQVTPDPQSIDTQTDPLISQARAQRTAVDLLRAIASPERPIVFVIDDLQWADRIRLGFVDHIMSGEAIPGLLLVCAYREEEIDPAHPMTPMLERWQQQYRAVKHLRLLNLTPSNQAELLTDILRTNHSQAAKLATVLAPRTNGNPYDTIELLNGLRHDNILTVSARGWSWDPHTLRQRMGNGEDITDLLVGRVQTMPSATRDLLETMACLGGRVDTSLLPLATGSTPVAVERRLAPALDDGLLVVHGQDTVRFRHDRIRETILQRLGGRRSQIQLSLARRLARDPDLFATTAQQYLPVVDNLTDAYEQRTTARLLQRAAEQANLLGNHAMVEKLLTAAVPLTDPTDTTTLVDIHTGRHAALYSLGRLAEADDVYHLIDLPTADPLARAEATMTQVSSLTNRGQNQDAVELGIGLLRQVGVALPMGRLDADIEDAIATAYCWADTPLAEDLRRPELTDPAKLAAAELIDRILTPAFLSGQKVFEWLALTALRMWAEGGPCSALVSPVSFVPSVLFARSGDYHIGREVLQRVIAVTQARGYETAKYRADFHYALVVGHWFEPLEQTVARSRRAREGLVRGGDYQLACHTYYVSVVQSLDYTPSLDAYLADVEAGLAFATRVGNEQTAEVFRAYRQLANVLQGRGDMEPVADIAARSPRYVLNLHVTHALAAAVLADNVELRQHVSAVEALPHREWTYVSVLSHLLRSLSLANEVRTSAATEVHWGNEALAELDQEIDWLASRAEDAPHNLGHLLRLAKAERAWAVGDFRAAVRHYGTAIGEVTRKQRPWHHAVIHERAARFYLAHGAEYTGHWLLAEARQAYQDWGAVAKVNQLDWAYATVRPPDQPHHLPFRHTHLATGTIDLMAILTASQALSSQTTIQGLYTQLVDILTAMTGATDIHLLIRDQYAQRWQLATSRGIGDGPTSQTVLHPLDTGSNNGAGQPPAVPLSAVRYTERTRQPLVVADATHDDRFTGDPYLTGLNRCALLAVPVLDRGQLRAMLLLENRLIRGAFTTERLDAVTLITSQLAASLDNAELYSTLEQRVIERTQQLAQANQRLEQLSTTDPLTSLPNRRHLERALNLQWQQASETGTRLTFAMVDVDRFKDYNDHYGHTAGDQCLQAIATTLRHHLRNTDHIARYGGEEFAVTMPDTDAQTALAIAHRLHAAITDLAIPHSRTPQGVVTVSIGVATTTPSPEETLDRLVEVADAQLYKAKQHGRNQVQAEPPRSGGGSGAGR